MARFGAPAALLAVEYLVLSLLVDFPTSGPAQALAGGARVLVPAALGAGAAGLFLARRVDARVREEVAALRAPGPWRRVFAHLAAFAVTAALAYRLMAPGAPAPSVGAFVAWGGCVGVTVLLALAIVSSPIEVFRLAARRLSAPLFAAGVGLLAWRAVTAADQLWGILQGAVLRTTAAALRAIHPAVTVVPEEAVLGVGGFEVVIAPVCSGADGIGLVLLFQLIWLVLARDRVRLGRALAVVPAAGIVAAFLANVARIATLVLVGASGREALAMGAFHSKLGWLLFIAIAFATVLVAEHVRWLQRESPAALDAGLPPAAAGYIAPLLAALAAALVTSLGARGGLDPWYFARVLAGAGVLLAFRRRLPRPALRLSWAPLGIAAAASALWLSWGGVDGSTLGTALAGLDRPARLGWLAVRILGGCVVLPVVEELAFRGFLLPWLVSLDFERVPARTWSWPAVVLSSLAFGALHGQWLLGSAVGALFAFARIWRGRLGDAVLAHVACNAAIAIVVLATERWGLWG